MPYSLTVETYPGSVAITPSDATAIKCRALFAGGAGTLIVRHFATDTSKTFTVVAGSLLPVELDDGRVMAASTATGIVALS